MGFEICLCNFNLEKSFLAEDDIAQKVLKGDKIYLVHDMCMPDVQYLDECQFSLQYVSITVTNTTNQSWQFVPFNPSYST